MPLVRYGRVVNPEIYGFVGASGIDVEEGIVPSISVQIQPLWRQQPTRFSVGLQRVDTYETSDAPEEIAAFEVRQTALLVPFFLTKPIAFNRASQKVFSSRSAERIKRFVF